MASRRSSGSSRRPSEVDPTRSTNMTVISRRSGSGTGVGLSAGRAVASRATPQSGQNRLSAGFSLPHDLQSHGKAVPQSPQNFLCGATWAPQRGQTIGPASSVSTAREPFYEATNMSGHSGRHEYQRDLRMFPSARTISRVRWAGCDARHTENRREAGGQKQNGAEKL